MPPEHTPTPWAEYGLIIRIGEDGSEDQIAQVCDWGPEYRQESLANARHIVKCVNYHERLAETLRKLSEMAPKELAEDAEILLTELENNQ